MVSPSMGMSTVDEYSLADSLALHRPSCAVQWIDQADVLHTPIIWVGSNVLLAYVNFMIVFIMSPEVLSASIR